MFQFFRRPGEAMQDVQEPLNSKPLDNGRKGTTGFFNKILPGSKCISTKKREKGLKLLAQTMKTMKKIKKMKIPLEDIRSIMFGERPIKSRKEFDKIFSMYSLGEECLYISKTKKNRDDDESKILLAAIEPLKTALEKYLKSKNSRAKHLGNRIIRPINHEVLRQHKVSIRPVVKLEFTYCCGKISQTISKKYEHANKI